MISKEQKQLCLDEMLGKDSFLVTYNKELHELINDTDFMQVIDMILNDNSPSIIFSPNKDDSAHKRFKKSLYDISLTKMPYARFPAYQRICASVERQGNTTLSAIISIFYAVVYLSVPMKPFESDLDYRKKWPADNRCDDGHYVRSRGEQLVDNWLYHHNICHAYEVKVRDKDSGKEYISDFYLPHIDTYVEVWGFKTPEYLARRKRKTEIYHRNGLKLIEMTDAEIKVLDDYLRRVIL